MNANTGRGTPKRRLTWTKKGPGRRHSKLPKKVVEAINQMRMKGAVIDPTNIEGLKP
jgi:hypothetical protein